MRTINKIELLAPAGDFERLKIAYLYGADAVYIGGKDYSLRANASNFTLDEIKKASDYAHKFNKKLYVTVNIVFHNKNYKRVVDYLKKLSLYGVDAIISSDPSIIDIVKENNIDLNIHISTQASTSNVEASKYWIKEGASRIVLARECSKRDIKKIIDEGIEVECFLHGAMCAAYSGRCVLSNYFTNRDANRGGCAQVCRWCFDLTDDNNTKLGNSDFTMCSKDLSMISCLGEMIDIGVSSLKVEGRMRSNYYIATVISTYREAIDNYYNDKLTKRKLNYYEKILNRVANRESIDQFFRYSPSIREQYFLGRQEVSNQDFLGIVLDYDKESKMVTISQRNYFKVGDKVEIFGPNIETFSCTIPKKIYNEDGELIEVANHPQEIIKFKLNKEVFPSDIMRIKVI